MKLLSVLSTQHSVLLSGERHSSWRRPGVKRIGPILLQTPQRQRRETREESSDVSNLLSRGSSLNSAVEGILLPAGFAVPPQLPVGRWALTPSATKIGRASCRESVEVYGSAEL